MTLFPSLPVRKSLATFSLLIKYILPVDCDQSTSPPTRYAIYLIGKYRLPSTFIILYSISSPLSNLKVKGTFIFWLKRPFLVTIVILPVPMLSYLNVLLPIFESTASANPAFSAIYLKGRYVLPSIILAVAMAPLESFI